MLGGMLIVPNDEEAADVVAGYREYVERAPEQLVTAVATVLAPPEPFVPPSWSARRCSGIIALWVGTPVTASLRPPAARPHRRTAWT